MHSVNIALLTVLFTVLIGVYLKASGRRRPENFFAEHRYTLLTIPCHWQINRMRRKLQERLNFQ